MRETSHEEVEWGINRKPLYEREREALREMEEMKDGANKCSSGNADEWSNQV